MANSVSIFDIKKVQQVAKKASDKAVEKATAHLWKVARNSVKKSSGREKKHDLNLLAWNDSKRNWDKVSTMKKYLSKPERQNEQIVQRDTTRDVRDPKTQGSRLIKKPSGAGMPPKSHKSTQPGWRDYWLKEGIRFDPKAGTVFLNPTRQDKGYGRSTKMPVLLEEGGDAISHTKVLQGYSVNKRYYKNGKVTVSYSPNYSRKIKRYRMQARPFLVPALKKAAEQLLKILKGSINK